MMLYPALKHLHVTCAVVSATGFLLRAGWMLSGSSCLQRRWVRVLPHVVDSLLLATAIALVTLSGQYPWRLDWLGAKLTALLVYIVCGSLALKRAPTPGSRRIFLVLALTALAYIFAVALTRNPYVLW